MACIKPPVVMALGKIAVIGVSAPAPSVGPTVLAPQPAKTPERSKERGRLSPGRSQIAETVRTAVDRSDRAARAAATMSLEQITAAKKEAQHELEAARNNPKATTSDVARLKSAVKSLQRAEAAKRSDPAGAGRSAHLLYGTARHKTQQYQDTTWAQSMGADSEAEFPIVKPDGSKGRVDHIIYLDGSRQNVLITEYKTDRFDLRTEKGLADRMDEIFDQINGYRFSKQLEDIESSQTLLHIDHRPTTTGYAEYVEERCAEKGVSVIFLDD